MARGAAAAAAAGVTEHNVVVLDNGAGFCKAGLAGRPDSLVVVPHCKARAKSAKKWVLADQLDQVSDIQGISVRRPLDRGYLIDSKMEKEIWDRIFKTLLKVRPSECGLLLVEPLFNPPSIQKSTDEIVFEELGFQSLYVGNAPALTHIYEARRAPESLLATSDCSLVVDSGFFFTHAAPVFDGFVINHAVKRLNLGGKALTNFMKELVSYRAWNMMDETYIMEDVKEKLCFVSLDIPADLVVARKRGKSNYFLSEYVLPDGIKHKRGFVKDPDAAAASITKRQRGEEGLGAGDKAQPLPVEEVRGKPKNSAQAPQDQQVLNLTNERFLVPEMLFYPADLGMNEAGLAELIVRAVNSCHPNLHPLLYSNVLLTGGSTLFPGFRERLEMELRPLVPDEYNVSISAVGNPLTAAWKGGCLLAEGPDFHAAAITKKEYEEHGTSRCRRRFMH
ncbi:unnamed protein product [Calypogeia fissa]